jgi:hypothetical protein
MEQLSQHQANDGFVSTTSPANARPNTMARGSSNTLITGAGRSVAHSGIASVAGLGSRALFQIADGGFAGLGDGATAGIGTVFGTISKAAGYIGQGLLAINGVSRAVNASTLLQFLLYRSGSYSGAGTGPYVVGLSQPSAPTIAVTPNASTTNSGTASAVIWFVRSATKGRSRKSAPSNVLLVDGKTVRLTVDASDLVTAAAFGYDRIGVGVTVWGFGVSGPEYAINSGGGEYAITSLTTVDGVANSLELQWSSAGIQGNMRAPIDDYPPPAAVFAAALEDVIAVIGAYGDLTAGVSGLNPGTAIAISLRGFVESFPPDALLILPEAPTGVLPRASDGFAFVGCKNSMHALVYTGGSPALSLQTVWATTGVAAQHNMFLGEGGRLYAFSNGKRGLVRIGAKGEPETAWASDVADEVATWNAADVYGGWDNDYQLAVFCHGRTVLAFNTQLERWCAPISLAGSLAATEVVCGTVTVGGSLYVATRDTASPGAALKLWTLHGGAGSTYEIYTQWEVTPAQADEIFQLEAYLRADTVAYDVTLKLFTNGDRTTPQLTRTVTLPRTGLQHLTLRPNVRGARSYCLYVSHRSAGGDAGLEGIRVSGTRSGVVA